jgi:leucyl/phenylalanyl-tRNA--protein transferase
MPVFQLTEQLIFPPPHLAADNGLLAVGGDLSPERLLLAYRLGIFPWFSAGDPILWWSPAPRLILEPHGLRISRRLQRTIRKGVFRVTMDTAFSQVITSCARVVRRHEESTWITTEIITAYNRLHELGFAHSVECWQGDTLAGGLYGVGLGGIFFGESMFSIISDSSKVALAHLAKQLAAWDFNLIDCQVKNEHLLRLGAREISRPEFQQRLADHINRPTQRGSWTSSYCSRTNS